MARVAGTSGRTEHVFGTLYLAEEIMLKRMLMTAAMGGALVFTGSLAWAADEEPTQQPEAQKQEQVYGSQLMTRQERAEHRTRMRAAKTAEEREQIRKEHHERMKKRAKERGVTLPDEPPPRGGGMGRGSPGGY
jgi:hypothetical protein